MKRIFWIVLPMLMLVGCHHNKQQSVISKNKQRWNQQVKKVEIKKHPSFGMMDYSNEPLTWQSLKRKNDLVILGTVVDYKKNKRQAIFPTTTVQIKINRVLSGKRKNDYITTTFPSGLGYEDEIEIDRKGEHKEVFYQKESFPLPKIGSQFVTGIVKSHGKYHISAPLFNFWVLNDDRLELNNKDLKKLSNDKKVAKLNDLTEFLNHKLNIGDKI